MLNAKQKGLVAAGILGISALAGERIYNHAYAKGLAEGILSGREQMLPSLVPFERTALRGASTGTVSTLALVHFNGRARLGDEPRTSGPNNALRFTLSSPDDPSAKSMTGYIESHCFDGLADPVETQIKTGETRLAVVRGRYVFHWNTPVDGGTGPDSIPHGPQSHIGLAYASTEQFNI